mmetsp:Transcript_77394/g.226972  ORF Transcript_77394/g.226972 Transcript_77394/m.226972 type:complete len:257 (-) Transcript_77394:2309-3079(-)
MGSCISSLLTHALPSKERFCRSKGVGPLAELLHLGSGLVALALDLQEGRPSARDRQQRRRGARQAQERAEHCCPAELRLERQPGDDLPHRQQARRLTLFQCVDGEQLLHSHLHGLGAWRVRCLGQKPAGVAAKGRRLEAALREVAPLHLRRRSLRCALQLLLAVQPQDAALTNAAGTAAPLHCRADGDTSRAQRRHAPACIVCKFSLQARVHDNRNVIDGHRALCDIGAEDDLDLALRSLLEHLLLLLFRQGRVQW